MTKAIVRNSIKEAIANIVLMFLGTFLGLLLIEFGLYLDGRYDSFASQELIASPAIYERPINAIEFHLHPDLKVPIENRTDADGVRNHSGLPTHRKTNIIGFFGDSFVENRMIEDRFSLTSILDFGPAAGARVVNYGVDGYGLDQSYLRYKKYVDHDIRHVVYVFCENDLRNLYETALTEIVDGKIQFQPPVINPFYRIIGRMRTTYLVLSAYFQAKVIVTSKDSFPDVLSRINWSSGARVQQARFHDQYADSVVADFLSQEPTPATSRNARKFLMLLELWKREVESSGRTFTVFVLPRPIDTAVASKLLGEFTGNAVYSADFFGNYSGYRFKSDDHWNEYGNLRAAELVASNTAFPFHREIADRNFLTEAKQLVDTYYRGFRLN